jgi:primosomal protein N' (replication factor Y)
VRVVDVLPAIRSSRFDLPLTYDARDLELRIGDVVRVALGKRDVLGFVVSPVHEEAKAPNALKPVAERLDVPRAFDEIGLHLAKFVAEHYLCTLGEALSAMVLADALPRMREFIVRTREQPSAKRHPSLPARLLDVIWRELPEVFPLEALLRHPAARRAADRRDLLRHVGSLVRSGSIHRERRLADPRTNEARITVLDAGNGTIEGKKARALVELVQRHPGIARAQARLAGFSNAVIARAVRAGALCERSVPAMRRRRSFAPEERHAPTAEQRRALEWVEAEAAGNRFATALLYGVTGSGKTFVYVEAIKRIVRLGRRAIVLVPEISLTPQTAQRFEAAFGERVAVLHSALSERERFEAWQACARGEIDVVIGARSAVFAPLPRVGLTIVDESHDPSYKQDVVPRYQVVAVAHERMKRERGVLLLGSATPSLESYAAARDGKIALLELSRRPAADALPAVRIVDLRKEFASGNRGIFSSALVQALAERLRHGEKSLLFVNRRGSARSLICRNCGDSPECPRCSVALAVHRGEELLRCHYCDYQTAIGAVCASCGADALEELGIGTERVAEEVGRLFPQARVMRMDSDTTTRVGDHARILASFEAEGDVLVGTQMIAKGLDYPSVTLVGVVAADLGLHLPDFRAAERSFALIAQVCGRSGRRGSGEAIVQTYAPEHPAVRFAARHDYGGFAENELHERFAIGYPPSRRLIYVGVLGRDRGRVIGQAHRYATMLQESDLADVLGPAPYPVARVNHEWRYRIALRSRKPAALRAFVRERIVPLARADRSTRLAINVDP